MNTPCVYANRKNRTFANFKTSIFFFQFICCQEFLTNKYSTPRLILCELNTDQTGTLFIRINGTGQKQKPDEFQNKYVVSNRKKYQFNKGACLQVGE